ncbi:Radial spoke head 10-like protein B2 isoform X4 [Aix galericulata]|nr:Radial spoke head 10-like protein B2 isoform X4 [Aix galericulata]
MAKDKKKDVKKSERSVRPSIAEQGARTESSSIKLTDLQEAQTSAAVSDKDPEEVEEHPVQNIPQYYDEPVLTELIVKSYEGEKVHGLYEGEGVAYFEGGNTYKGMFSEGFMHGQGTYTWADGVKYEGTFVKNVQMFNGCYTWSDGSYYEGSIENGLRHGFGFFRSSTHPVSYIGYWYKGKRHGKGTVFYDREHTSWYSGDWVNNVKEGWGMRCYKSGNTYEGQWEKNVRHGRGRMRWLTDNQEYIGQWVYGIQHGYGTHIWFLKRMPASQYPLRNKYIGNFVNGERHGRGRFIYASGAVYDGEWVCNKKHGKGKFVFKNGNVYEGEFIDDNMVGYPAFQVGEMNAQELKAICTGSHFGTETIEIINNSENPSTLGSDIELDISSLLDLLPGEERQEEMKQVEFAVLRHITELRRIYSFYSSLGCDDAYDNTFLMTRLQFWRFLKDCQLHHSNITLAEMDRILSGDKTPLEEIHSPYETLLFRTFLSRLIHLAFHIYHKEHKDKGPYLSKCFVEMMSRNVIPTACHIQEKLPLTSVDPEFKSIIICVVEVSFETNRNFNTGFKDFKLLSKQLTASRLVEILVKDGPSLHDSSSINLEQELVFLEFVEALLDCALVYVTNDVIKEQVDHDNQKKSNSRVEVFSKKTTNVSLCPEYSLSQPLRPSEDRGQSLEEFLMAPDPVLSFHTNHGEVKAVCSLSSWDTDKGQDLFPAVELTDKLEAKTGKDEEFGQWMYQVQIFFIKNFFPAYHHEKALREKIKENRIQDAELAELRNMKDEELAKLIAEREAEEAKRQEEATVEKESSEFKNTANKELEEPGAQLVPPPKEEASVVPPPVVTKVPAGTKRKKK